MSFLQSLLTKPKPSRQQVFRGTKIGDMVKQDCSTHLYNSCRCAETAFYNNKYANENSYYTVWSFVFFIVGVCLLLLYLVFMNKIPQKYNIIITSFIVTSISNSITVCFISQLLYLNTEVDSVEQQDKPEAMDFYSFKTIIINNFIYHQLPLFISLFSLFLLLFIPKTVPFKKLFTVSLGMYLAFFFVWLFVPTEFTDPFTSKKEKVYGWQKLKYMYSNPELYILILFPLISVISTTILSAALSSGSKQGLKKLAVGVLKRWG